jgi:high-affinity K+ transport system ATPase subunit B
VFRSCIYRDKKVGGVFVRFFHCEYQQFYEAGIQVKVVTGDNTVTTKAIAEMAGIKIPRTLWKVKRL